MNCDYDSFDSYDQPDKSVEKVSIIPIISSDASQFRRFNLQPGTCNFQETALPAVPVTIQAGG
jgi:hypothetical protein